MCLGVVCAIAIAWPYVMKVQWNDGADGVCLCTYAAIDGERLANWLLKFGRGGCHLASVSSHGADPGGTAVTLRGGKLTPQDCLGRPFVVRYLAAAFAGLLAAAVTFMALMRIRTHPAAD
jgi:hypothetical protein